MTVWKAPPVLCLHLKRFKMDFVTREKLHTLVSFPQTLDMSRFVTGEASKGLYQLVGVCNHVGGLSGTIVEGCVLVLKLFLLLKKVVITRRLLVSTVLGMTLTTGMWLQCRRTRL